MLKQIFIDHPLVYYFSIVGLAFFLVRFSIPSIIHAANKHQLFDALDLHRKEHRKNISRLGGIGLFCGFTITVLLFATTVSYQQANFLITSCIILFALGIKDDIYGVSPKTKLGLQIVVAIILVGLGDFRLTSLYGVFNVWEVHSFVGGVFSIALIIFINNAFNLIDGVDGLAATVGAIVCLCFGVFFALSREVPYAFIAFSMFGAVMGFLVFNYPPAKIFMGDTGSLIIGLVAVVLAIKFIEINKVGVNPHPYFYSAPAIAVSVLIVPVFDSLRIFFIRLLNKKSPFRGDRNHIHHRLLRLGLNAKQIMLVTAIFNIGMIIFTVMLQNLGNFVLIFLQIGICVALNVVFTYVKGKRKTSDYTLKDVFIKDTLRLS
ncbi:MraY family glycosyltransferase [Pedobacter sp. ASV28]|uniref:MraY family glycosyltransferase n=1 Tax=Pedobacter sp. ASV28 TaxID=2795123 RepID=UPI0018ECD9B6|nr:MraY family glycosyltransferase [Pedobacter sp. ASV28]